MRRLCWLMPLAVIVLGGPSMARAAPVSDESAFDKPGLLGIGFAAVPSLLTEGRLGFALTGKLYLPIRTPLAVQATVGPAFRLSTGLAVHVDLLYAAPRVHEERQYTLNVYAGLGGAVGFLFSDCSLCLNPAVVTGQLVAGLAWQLKAVPLEAAVEWRPGVALAQVGDQVMLDVVLFAGMISARYFFW